MPNSSLFRRRRTSNGVTGASSAGIGSKLAVVRAGHCGPDPFHDLICFILGDLDELVFQVAALGTGSAQDQLSARLAGLELPACPAAPAPAGWGPWTSGPFTVAASVAGTQVQPALTSIEVAPEAGGWQISLIEPANALTLPVGAGAWTVF